jgi:hypothetical protein
MHALQPVQQSWLITVGIAHHQIAFGKVSLIQYEFIVWGIELMLGTPYDKAGMDRYLSELHLTRPNTMAPIDTSLYGFEFQEKRKELK